MTDEVKEITLQKIREEYDKNKMLDLHQNIPTPYLLINKLQDLSKLNEYINTVRIAELPQEDYSIIFHAIKQFPQITCLEIFDIIPYIFLDSEDLGNIENLRLVVKATEPFVAFSMPKLKVMRLISINDKPDLLDFMDEKVYFDFSFFPSLKSLYISGWINLDSKCFQTLQSLEYLTFKQEDFINLDWLQYVPPLRKLNLQYDSIESILPIVRYQSQLEFLDLFRADVAANDLQILAKMPNLQKLDIRHCPISAEQEKILRDSKIQTLLVNIVDMERKFFAYKALELGMKTGSRLYHREKHAEEERKNNHFSRRSIDAARPWEDRALEMIQTIFLEEWETVKTWNFIREKEILEPYRTEFCRSFLESALIMYPTLLLSREMAEVLYAQRTIPPVTET